MPKGHPDEGIQSRTRDRAEGQFEMSVIETIQRKAHALKQDTLTLYLTIRDPRTPWYARAMAAAVVATR